MINLIDNANKYGYENTPITLSAEIDNNKAQPNDSNQMIKEPIKVGQEDKILKLFKLRVTQAKLKSLNFCF